MVLLSIKRSRLYKLVRIAHSCRECRVDIEIILYGSWRSRVDGVSIGLDFEAEGRLLMLSLVSMKRSRLLYKLVRIACRGRDCSVDIGNWAAR